MSKVKVIIEGVGAVEIKRPKKFSKGTFDEAIVQAVSDTLTLWTSRNRGVFHPVLGAGGYDSEHSHPGVALSEARSEKHRD